MASAKTLRHLIKAGASGDVVAFRQDSELVIGEERQKQYHLFANDLEQFLYGSELAPLDQVRSRNLPEIPTDKERGLPSMFDNRNEVLKKSFYR